MGLRDITIHRTSVPYRDQTLEVRGISGADLMVAAQDYGPQIAVVFGKIQSGEFGGDVKSTIMKVSRDVPEVAGAIIALASDDYTPETVKIATQLPLPIQVEALEAVFHETFYSEADVKKLIESLTRMITAVSGVLTETMPPLASRTGIGDFAAKRAS